MVFGLVHSFFSSLTALSMVVNLAASIQSAVGGKVRASKQAHLGAPDDGLRQALKINNFYII